MTAPARARLVVLASGGGSNLGALFDYLDSLGAGRRADVVGVASDRAGAGALERARTRDVPAVRLQTSASPEGEPLAGLLARLGADIVVLAGYLRLVPLDVVQRYHGRIVNVHPALLPAFGGAGMHGMRVHSAVLAAGARLSGPTVHFVDEVFDRGAVLAQWPVPVLQDDTAERLAARVLEAEHALYPRVVHAVATGDAVLGDDGRAHWTRAPAHEPRFVLAPPARGADDGNSGLLYPNH